MYKKDLKVVDCTIRDGGLINKWQFSDDMVRKVFHAVEKSGVDYMEIGYRASTSMFPPSEYGPWRFSTDEKVREIIGDTKTDMKLGVMIDIGRVELDDIAPASESPLSFMRIATYLKDIDKAISLANHCHDKGYESFINIMAISTSGVYDLDEALRQVNDETQVSAVSIVDSYGALFSESIHHLVQIFKTHLKDGKKVGIHAHNNQQLGFANTIESIRKGVSYCDATIAGLGRAAGNCPLELLLSFLKNPKYDLEPILQVLEDVFVDLRDEIEWGYLIPYMITGTLNQHPRSAIALRQDPEKREQYAKFFKQMTTPETLN